MLRMIYGLDKCPAMVADSFLYHRVGINACMTRIVHSQENACPSTHTSPYGAVMDPVRITPR